MSLGTPRAGTGGGAVAAAVTTAAMILALARPAAAQDVRIVVRIDLSDVQRQLESLTKQTLPEIRSELRDALRDVTNGLDDLGTSVHARPQRGPTARTEQTDTSTQPLAIGPTGTLDISVWSGSITVMAGAGAPTLQVIKKARGRTEADARQAMDRVTVVPDGRGGRVRVEPGYHGRLDVDLALVATVPAGIAVNAQASNGAITITGIRGDVLAHTMNGAITLSGVPNLTEAHSLNGPITISDTQTDRALTAESMSGAIHFNRVKARRVSANTSGDVLADSLDCAEASLKAFNGTVTFRGAMQPNGHYEIHTYNGAVHFEPEGSVGFELDASSYSGVVRIDPTLRLQSSRTGGHSLTGTVGNGAATVTIVTFNGAVVIGKR
jgi:hypothetical protein